MLRKTTDSYRAEVLQKTGGAYVVTGEYVNRDTPIRFLHDIPTCGREFELTPKYFYKYTYPCPYCRKEQFHQNNIKAHAVFVAEVAERYGEEYTVLGTYRGSKASIELQHNSAACHFRVFRCTPNNFLRGHTCPACNQVGQSYP